MPDRTALPQPYFAPRTEDLIAMAEAALASIPAHLAEHVRGTAILVEDVADDAILRDMDIDDPLDLTGIYMPAGNTPHHPTTILLFRVPILVEWIETGVDLHALVHNVVIHEIAHHFGFSDDDIHFLES